jgi:predicted RNA binding protein with dsRBD fold (UPF0201 family)
MKKNYLFGVLVLMILAGCKNPRQAPVQQPVPEALQPDKSDYSLLTKSRSGDNLVEELYNELMEKNPVLDSLEQSVDKVMAGKTDSAAAFHFFHQKNNSFYTEAGSYTSRITDSAVKMRIMQLLDNSMAGYKNKTAAHNSLLDVLNKKNSTLADLHIVLKLVKTIGVMEQYQATNIPPLKPLQSVAASYDKVIAATKALSSQ